MTTFFYKQAAQATLLTVLSIAFWKSRQPVIVLTSFLVLAGVIFNAFIFIHNTELDRKKQAPVQQTGRYIAFALILQIIVIIILGLFTWVLIYRKAEIFKTLL